MTKQGSFSESGCSIGLEKKERVRMSTHVYVQLHSKKMNKVLKKNIHVSPADILPEIQSFVQAYFTGATSIDALGEMLYTKYYSRIERYFSFRISDKSEAEDLAQTVFLKIIMSLKNGLWEGTGDICYIFTVARNTLIDYFRRAKHASIVSDELVETFADSVTTTGHMLQREQRELLLAAMEDLREEEAHAVTLRYFADMEYPLIAKTMHKKECAVRQLVHRGLKSLRSNAALKFE